MRSFMFVFCCVFVGCQDVSGPTLLEDNHSAWVTEVSRSDYGGITALGVLTNSQVFKSALSRVEDQERVRINLEHVEKGAYIFWVWEDRDTHAVTLERIKVAPDRSVFHVGELDGDWGHWLPTN